MIPPGPNLPPAAQGLRWMARPYEFLSACADELGEPFSLDFGSHGAYVLIWSPDVLRDFFRTGSDRLQAGRGNRILEPFLGPGSLLLLEGERHLRERRMLLPAFREGRVREHRQLIDAVAERVIRAWVPGKVVHVQEAMQQLSLDVILEAVFGMHARGGELQERIQHFLNDPRLNLALLGRLDDDLEASGTWQTLRARLESIRVLLSQEIRERRTGPRGGDVLSILLDATDEENRPLADDDLRDELLTLLVTGYETTATALSWAVYWLARNPAVADTARREVRGLSPSDAASAPYLDALCREVLRIHPVIPVVAREVREPVTLAGHEIPRGVTVAGAIYLAHHRRETWGDPERFRPERFLESSYGPYAYLPFGGGPRRCIGMQLALSEMRITLACMLRDAEFDVLHLDRVRPVRRTVTVAPSGGPRIEVRSSKGGERVAKG